MVNRLKVFGNNRACSDIEPSKIFVDINLLLSVYPSRFVNVKSKYRKEVNYERLTILKIWLEYHRAHSKHNTIRAYQFTIAKFNQHFANQNLKEMSTDDILDFMAKFTEGQTPQTKRIRFSHLTAFINFMGNNFDCDFKNPCDSPKQMIFPICHGAARAMVGKAGKLVGIRLRPYDLRRHAATFASCSNVPLEIISKIILRHSKTTEIYLGKVSDTEAIRWIENLLNLTRSEITFDLF